MVMKMGVKRPWVEKNPVFHIKFPKTNLSCFTQPNLQFIRTVFMVDASMERSLYAYLHMTFGDLGSHIFLISEPGLVTGSEVLIN